MDLKAAGRALARCDLLYLAYLALWLSLDRVLMSYKWQLLLACRGIAVGQAEALKAYYVATFAGSFLPSTVGGDALRVAAVCGDGRPSEAVAASVFLERVLGFVAAALPPWWVWPFGRHQPGGAGGVHLLDPGLLAALLIVLAFSLSAPSGRLLEKMRLRLEKRGRIGSWAARFLLAYHAYRGHRLTLIWFLLLSFIEQSAPVVGTWLAARALHVELSLWQAAAVTPLAFFFARLPVAVSSFGVVEGLYVAFFALVGLNPTDSFLLGFLLNLGVVITSLPTIPLSDPRPASGSAGRVKTLLFWIIEKVLPWTFSSILGKNEFCQVYRIARLSACAIRRAIHGPLLRLFINSLFLLVFTRLCYTQILVLSF